MGVYRDIDYEDDEDIEWDRDYDFSNPVHSYNSDDLNPNRVLDILDSTMDEVDRPTRRSLHLSDLQSDNIDTKNQKTLWKHF